MARLNEPPVAPQPSADTVDAVKRRFLRQNRELAKTNSQQSIRIRSLENDCSRLLAENLSLREQVLQLQNALETHSSRPSFENIDAVRSRLAAKIQELDGLVAELGQLKKTEERPRCKSQTAATRRSPGERQWRSGLGLQEVENQMMPTIVEDKFYPRRTMGADEFQGILDDPDSQSPDIGPPPVSRFENEDPIAFDPNPAPKELAQEPAEDGEPALSVNLETRKKRRESGPKLNIRRVSVFRSPPEESGEQPTKTVRAGAKRKFSAQEEEEKASAPSETFRFSRRNASIASETAKPNEETRPPSPERPVLGTKPVNTDPVLSPKKQRSSAQEKSGEKKPLPAPKTRGRLTITRNVTQSEPPLFEITESIPTAEINFDTLPPKTPAADSILSPPSTEPSTSRPESKDTPPPGEINQDDQTGQGGRPSRRARPQVSYKEPSLATKMRRPGKELVAAVYPQQDRRTSVESHHAPSTTKKDTTIGESNNGLGWKPIAGREGEEEGEMGSPLRQKLDRKEGSQEPKAVTMVEPTTMNAPTANAIAALISETNAIKRKSIAAAKTGSGASEPSSQPKSSMKKASAISKEDSQKDNLAIFDFTDSSPAEKAPNDRARITDLAKAARNARRHSSVPASSATEERKIDKAEGALPSLHKRTGSGGVKSASTANLNKSMTSTKANSKETKMSASGLSSTDMRTKIRAIGGTIEEGSGKGTGSLRAERAASRRKSMML